MALQLFDRVLVTATANTTVSFTLGSAVAGYQSFSVMTNGDTTYYGASDGTNWEVGLGTYASSGPTLTRTTILSSSNSGSAVTFSGTPNVWIDYPAGKSVYEDASNNVTLPGTLTSTGITTPSVTATTTDLTLSAISTGKINFNTLGGNQVQITDATTAGQFTLLSRGNALNEQQIVASGTANLGLYATGGGVINFWTATTGEKQCVVSRTVSAVNYLQVTGGATGSGATISTQGSDGNAFLALSSKGVSALRLQTGGSSQVLVTNTSSPVNQASFTGSIAGLAIPYSVTGSDTNISMAFQPKGTGAIDLAAGSSGVNISNGGTVTAISRTNAGANYTSKPTLTISAPTTAGGVQAVATIDWMTNNGATVQAGGTGYTVGDVLTVVGGTPVVGAATLTVATVSSGVITSANVTNFGSYITTPTNPVSVTGGTGTSATFNLIYSAGNTYTFSNAGSGYIEQPTVSFSGGGGSGVAAYATVGSVPTIKTIASALSFTTPSSEVFRIVDANSTGQNYISLESSGGGSNFRNAGAGTNLSTYFISKGTGTISFATNASTSTEQLRVSHTASAVNRVEVTGSATGGLPIISVQGSDANIPLAINSKGTSSIRLGFNNTDYLAINTATAGTNYIQSLGGSANIDIGFIPKGTGVVQFGTYTATVTAVAGYIQIKDSGGTLRKLAVLT